eukprot:SAG31_NODE_44273_length_263_cov_0.945122_1_plen_65_part_01
MIGGGIAGCGAAWALARPSKVSALDTDETTTVPAEVVLFEKEPRLGGNAKTHEWRPRAGLRQCGE